MSTYQYEDSYGNQLYAYRGVGEIEDEVCFVNSDPHGLLFIDVPLSEVRKLITFLEGVVSK